MSIIGDVKEVAELIQKLDNMELYQKILNLQGQIIELTHENWSLQEKNKKLREKLSVSKKMKFKKSLYYQENDPVPFCPLCWEAKKLPIHLIEFDRPDANTTVYKCHNCSKSFTEKHPPMFKV
jgi:hypothetical protein